MLTQTNESGPRAEDTRAAKTLSSVEGGQAMTQYLTKLQKDLGVGTPGFNAANYAYFRRVGIAARQEAEARAAQVCREAGVTAEAAAAAAEVLPGLAPVAAAMTELSR